MISQWVVAGAEIVLACGTVLLAVQARNEARAVGRESVEVGEQVKLQREQVEAAQRPVVIPAPPASWSAQSPPYHETWAKLLPVKNVGPGVALNVQGGINFGPPSGVGVDIIPTSLGSGDAQDLILNWAADPRREWLHVTGWLDYEDINGARWRTDFRVDAENPGERLRVNVQRLRLMMQADGTVVPDTL